MSLWCVSRGGVDHLQHPSKKPWGLASLCCNTKRTPPSPPRAAPSPRGSKASYGGLQHLALPSHSLSAILNGLRIHRGSKQVQEVGLAALYNMLVHACEGVVSAHQAMAEAGVIEAVVEAMQTHFVSLTVLERGLAVLHEIARDDEITFCGLHQGGGDLRKQHMVNAGAAQAIIGGLRTHESSAKLQEKGVAMLCVLASGNDVNEDAGPFESSVHSRAQQMADAGAIEFIVSSLHSQRHSEEAQVRTFGALCDMSSGSDEGVEGRAQRMVEAGAIEAIVAGLHALQHSAEVQEDGFVALCNLSGGSGKGLEARAQIMVDAGAVQVVVAGLRAHEDSTEVQERGSAVLYNILSSCGSGADADRRLWHAVEVGVVEVVTAGRRAHAHSAEVQDHGLAVLQALEARSKMDDLEPEDIW